MPDFAQSLQLQDLEHLRAMIELWGVEVAAPDVKTAIRSLAAAVLDEELVAEVVAALPEESRMALTAVQSAGGRLPWSQFARRFGEVREMGPAKRAREHPHRSPVSTSETLWFRGLVARAFFDTANGPEEFAYIPTDLLPLLPQSGVEEHVLGRPATPAERGYFLPANDHILDAACTLLAGLRLGLPEAEILAGEKDWPLSLAELTALLKAAGIVDANSLPEPQATQSHLEAQRGVSLAQLAGAWRRSEVYNDLRLLPSLQAEGEWSNDPRRTRRAVLAFLDGVPANSWWSLEAFISDIRAKQPDYQRPAGDYDSWYLKDRESGEYLRGFGHWDEVDGALVRHMITGPLHALGFLDLAAPEKGAPPSAFRHSKWAPALLLDKIPQGFPAEDQKLYVESKAQVQLPLLSARAVRYQVARFCEWRGVRGEHYRYVVTPAALERARSQNLRAQHLLALLKQHTAALLPPNLVQALERYERHGPQARLENVLVLRLGSPEILQALRSSRAARFLGEPLGPAAVVVKPGAWENVMAALAEMGYLGDASALKGEEDV